MTSLSYKKSWKNNKKIEKGKSLGVDSISEEMVKITNPTASKSDRQETSPLDSIIMYYFFSCNVQTIAQITWTHLLKKWRLKLSYIEWNNRFVILQASGSSKWLEIRKANDLW